MERLPNLKFGHERANCKTASAFQNSEKKSLLVLTFTLISNFLSPVFVPEPYEVVKKVPYTVEVSYLILSNTTTIFFYHVTSPVVT